MSFRRSFTIWLGTLTLLCFTAIAAAQETGDPSLTADWIMAKSSQHSVLIAIFQLVFSVIGTAAIVITVWQSRKSLSTAAEATKHASEAAVAATKAANAAEEANVINRNFFQAEIRPWLSVEILLSGPTRYDHSVSDFGIPLLLKVKNEGRTPALGVVVLAAAEDPILPAGPDSQLRELCERVLLTWESHETRHSEVVFPGSVASIESAIWFHLGDKGIFSRRVPILVLYRDTTGSSFITAAVITVMKRVGDGYESLNGDKDRGLDASDMQIVQYPTRYVS